MSFFDVIAFVGASFGTLILICLFLRRSSRSRSTLQLRPDLAISLANTLEQLLTLPLLKPSDIPAWLDSARTFQTDFNNHFLTLPKDTFWEIMHFLSDPDIRLRDREYALIQEGKIKRIIADLRRNNAHIIKAEQGA